MCISLFYLPLQCLSHSLPFVFHYDIQYHLAIPQWDYLCSHLSSRNHSKLQQGLPIYTHKVSGYIKLHHKRLAFVLFFPDQPSRPDSYKQHNLDYSAPGDYLSNRRDHCNLQHHCLCLAVGEVLEPWHYHFTEYHSLSSLECQ